MLLKTLHEFCHAVVGTLLAAFKQWVHVGMVQDQARRRSFKKAKQRVPPAKLCACERDNALHSAQPSTPTVLTSSTLRKRDQHITLVCPIQLSFGSGRSHGIHGAHIPPCASVALEGNWRCKARRGPKRNRDQRVSTTLQLLQRFSARLAAPYMRSMVTIMSIWFLLPQDCSSGASNPRQIALRGVMGAGYRADSHAACSHVYGKCNPCPW